MADSGDQMKHSILKLALFVGFGDSDDSHDHQPRYRPHSTGARSTRSLAAGDGAVGLAILAAMSASRDEQVRSEPVLIGGSVVTKPGVLAASVKKGEVEEGVMELSESYTCVISHLGGNRVKKRIYFGDGDDGVVFEPPPPLPSEIADPPFVVAEFLRFCSMCKRKLDGRDVYMYR